MYSTSCKVTDSVNKITLNKGVLDCSLELYFKQIFMILLLIKYFVLYIQQEFLPSRATSMHFILFFRYLQSSILLFYMQHSVLYFKVLTEV